MIVEPLVQGAAGILVQPPGLPAPGARAVRPPRRAPDLRRGRDRLRPHRHDVRLRAGARRAGLPLPRQGPHRRLPAARRDARDRARSTRASSAPRRTGAPSSTATPSPATRSPARRRSPASTRSRARATLLRLQPKIRLLGELLAEVAEMPEVAEVRGRGFMVGIDLGEHDPALRLGHRVVLEARERGAIVRPLGDVDRADAAAVDQQGRPAAAGRDRRRVDPRRVRRCVRRGARDRGARPSRTRRAAHPARGVALAAGRLAAQCRYWV